MEFYKTLKKFASKAPKAAAIGILAAIPYICESCGYSSIKAYAIEAKQEGIEKSQTLDTTLETVVEK